ncbi:hypothetical protein [Actinoallomurus soli]|uniref:hypothetical protein n=1 Tax=Actinoallomurus soli TaxID=2952535 RepID=UPI0020927C24|nr:hypothetical protein [Actinoallomurus soli]MCO5967625.1 hypothetical protein [Actinoallomurus soli]
MPPKPAELVRRPTAWLVAVAVLLTALEFAVVVPHGAVGWDEALYITQVSPRMPAAFFSAPRARGITYLIAPVVWLTGSVIVLRAYLAVLGAAAIVLAYLPWLAVASRRAVVPLAALLFTGLWVTGYYVSEVIPNFWVAVGGVALAGWFVRYAVTGGRGALIGVVLAGAVTTLMRPGDAFWIALPLPVAAVLVRRWRRPALVGAVLGGLALGAAQWIAEAFLRYGGPVARLHRSSAIEGGIAWHPRGLLYELSAVNGPLLCRPCGVGVQRPGLTLWWAAVPLLAAGGLVLAARARALGPVAVAAACGVSAAVPYLLFLGYAAPRFLLPAYALLALPVAECLTRLPAAVSRLRRPLTGLIAAVVLVQLGSQGMVLSQQVRENAAERRTYARGAATLERLGVRPPCLLSGPRSVPVAFYIGCGTGETGGVLASTTPERLLRTARREPTGILSPGSPPPGYATTWVAHPLSRLGRHWRVYLPPWFTPPR